eukprot:COSAG04_NODE_17739_length_460_cov_0.900277_1_plen_35_part_10
MTITNNQSAIRDCVVYYALQQSKRLLLELPTGERH